MPRRSFKTFWTQRPYLSKSLRYPWDFLRWLFLSRPIRFTRFGLFYIVFTIGVGAAAINTGNNLLYLILGLFLGFIVISGILSDSCLWGISLDWKPMEDLFADKQASFEIEVSKNWFPAIIVWLEATFRHGETYRQLIPWLPRYSTQRLYLPITPLSRGSITLTQTRITSAFPFGLFHKFHTDRSEQQWLVYPALRPLEETTLRALGDGLSPKPSGKKGEGSIPFDIREYREGDSLRRIHWKSTARRNQWMIAEMESENSQGRFLWVSEWPEKRFLEDFLSFLTSLLVHMYQKGLSTGLQTPGKHFQNTFGIEFLHAKLSYLAQLDPALEPRIPSGPPPSGGIDVLTLWKPQ